MKLVQYSAIIILATASALHAQPGPYEATGVSPYVQPKIGEYRLLFGSGGDAGLGMKSPQSYIGSLSHQSGEGIVSIGFVTSNPVSNAYPRITYTEFDLLYGFALDNILLRYGRPTNIFHASISAGVSIDDNSSRWRRLNRHDTAYYFGPPNSSEVVVGLPVQLQAVYEPFRYAGIGAILFYNLSKLQPSYGAAIMLELRY